MAQTANQPGLDDLTAQPEFWFTPAANFTKTSFSGA
jgi:hypothetical protein